MKKHENNLCIFEPEILLHVCSRVADAVGLKMNWTFDNCSALTGSPTFIQK